MIPQLLISALLLVEALGHPTGLESIDKPDSDPASIPFTIPPITFLAVTSPESTPPESTLPPSTSPKSTPPESTPPPSTPQPTPPSTPPEDVTTDEDSSSEVASTSSSDAPVISSTLTSNDTLQNVTFHPNQTDIVDPSKNASFQARAFHLKLKFGDLNLDLDEKDKCTKCSGKKEGVRSNFKSSGEASASSFEKLEERSKSGEAEFLRKLKEKADNGNSEKGWKSHKVETFEEKIVSESSSKYGGAKSEVDLEILKKRAEQDEEKMLRTLKELKDKVEIGSSGKAKITYKEEFHSIGGGSSHSSGSGGGSSHSSGSGGGSSHFSGGGISHSSGGGSSHSIGGGSSQSFEGGSSHSSGGSNFHSIGGHKVWKKLRKLHEKAAIENAEKAKGSGHKIVTYKENISHSGKGGKFEREFETLKKRGMLEADNMLEKLKEKAEHTKSGNSKIVYKEEIISNSHSGGRGHSKSEGEFELLKKRGKLDESNFLKKLKELTEKGELGSSGKGWKVESYEEKIISNGHSGKSGHESSEGDLEILNKRAKNDEANMLAKLKEIKQAHLSKDKSARIQKSGELETSKDIIVKIKSETDKNREEFEKNFDHLRRLPKEEEDKLLQRIEESKELSNTYSKHGTADHSDEAAEDFEEESSSCEKCSRGKRYKKRKHGLHVGIDSHDSSLRNRRKKLLGLLRRRHEYDWESNTASTQKPTTTTTTTKAPTTTTSTTQCPHCMPVYYQPMPMVYYY